MTLLVARPAAAVGVPTIYDNERVLPLGGRAAGLAGAYTALACDEGAMHYNLAALGCADASRLEVSGSAYVLQHLSVPEAFGTGQDLSTTNYHSIPTLVGGVRILSEGDPETRVGQWAFGFGVEVPRSLSLKAAPANEEEPNAITAQVEDVLTRGDLGIGAQVHRAWAIGLGLGASLRTYEAAFNRLTVPGPANACGPLDGSQCLDFHFGHRDEELLAVGLHARAGVRFTPAPRWSLGLAVESPSLDVYGDYTARRTQTLGLLADDGAGNTGPAYNPVVYRVRGDSELSLPLRLALGAAYSSPGFTFSADLSLAFPRDVDMATNTESVQVRGVPFIDESADVTLHRTFQPNAAVGMEVEVAEETVIDLGAFTDLSSVADEDVASRLSDRVHQFGGTAAIGLLGKNARGFFGLSFQYGRGDTEVTREFDLEALVGGAEPASDLGRVTRWSLAGFLASSYSFDSED